MNLYGIFLLSEDMEDDIFYAEALNKVRGSTNVYILRLLGMNLFIAYKCLELLK